jgi:glucosyl-3-phosphoglycerate synthase
MSPRAPLPARILIPVANPATAEDLVRIGVEIMDPRAGELTVLGIVEVPEDVALSDGATQARHARRLLQKVLDYAPPGTRIRPLVRIGRRAAEGIVEAATEVDADLLIFGWGGRTGGQGGRSGGRPGGAGGQPDTRAAAAGPVFSATIDAVVREPPCDIAVVKQRPFGEVRRILVPVRGGPHAELALAFADALARRHHARIAVLHVIPPGVTSSVRAQAEQALATFLREHARGHADGFLREAPNVRTAILREAEKADVVIMGASAAPEGTAADAFLFGALPEAIAARARPPVIVVKTRERIGRATFEELAGRAESLAAADRAAEESRAVPARVERWFAESNFHHGEYRNLRRLVDLKEQGLPSVSSYRREREATSARSWPAPGASWSRACRWSTSSGHRLGVQRSNARDRPGRGRARRPASRHPVPLRLVPGQGRGALEEPLRDVRRPRRLVRHGCPQLAPTDGLRILGRSWSASPT